MRFEPEVVDRLADHREHGVQRERRAQHDLVAHGVVDRVAVVLLYERVDLLVRDEQEEAVDRLVGRVEVAAGGELLHPVAHVAQELVALSGAFDVVRGFEVADVVVERELHVHVHDEPVGQEERVVGPTGTGERRLLAIVDAFEEARELQHVFGHPLAPLAAHASWRAPRGAGGCAPTGRSTPRAGAGARS